MYKITETQFDELPKELQDLYEKLPNHSREEVLECFPNTKSGNLSSGHKRGDGTGNSLMGGGGIIQGNYGGDSGSAARFFYCAKASKKDRDDGLEGFEEKQIRRLSGGEFAHNSGSENSDKNGASVRNNHPTVKPTALMRYLVKLVTPPGGTVLDPFTGSGSTGKACKLEGFDFIGIEREEEYVKIAEARIKAVPDTLL